MNRQLSGELRDAVKALDGDDRIGCIVITGAGTRAFSAGGDIHEQREDDRRCTQQESDSRRGRGSYEIAASAKPTIGMLNGLAYGGAAMPLAVIRRAIEAFPKTVGFVNAYGQTETTSSLTVLGPDDHRIQGSPAEIELKLKRLNSIGKPLPDVEIRVRDEGNNFLPAGEVGEIIIRTPRIMKGYAGREDDAALADGWRATGDLGWIDGDGYVFFAGRKDDMIIRGGENIYPREIEEFLYTHPGVSDVQVIGVPSQRYGEEVMVWVKLREGEEVSDEALTEFCRGKIATFKIPRYWKFVDAFPMTVTGKIQKFKMREAAVSELGLEKAAAVATA